MIDILSILRLTADRYPRAWQHAHHDHDVERYDFIILAGKRLYAESNGTVGLNWRRAMIGDLSMDGITVQLADGKYYFADVISGAGGPNPQLVYQTPGPEALLRDAAGVYAPHGFADPRPMKTAHDYGGGPVEPPAPVTPAYPGDAYWVAFGDQLQKDYARAHQALNGGSGIWFARVIWDHVVNKMPLADAVKKQREGPDGWLKALGLTP